jgi:hypothetical protein
MDKLVSRIVDLFSFLADVLTVVFVIHSLSGLTFRQMLSRLAVRENPCKAWNLFTEFLRTLDRPEVPEDAPTPPVQNTTIVPLTGTLRLNVFDNVNMGLNNRNAALPFRQNAYYYSQEAPVTVSLTGQAIMAQEGRLTTSSGLSL